MPSCRFGRTFCGVIALVLAVALTLVLPIREVQAQTSAPPAAVAVAVTLAPRAGGATLMLDLTGEVSYHISVMQHPNRIVIDLPKVTFASGAGRPVQKAGPVSAFRYGLFFADRSRVVLDLSAPALVERVDSNPVDNHWRLSFHIGPVDAAKFISTAAEHVRDRAAIAAVAAPSGAGPVVADGKGALPLVVIDAGHGGIDPGATAPTGEAEKTIVFHLAQTLKERLEKSGKVRVAMTRTTDVFVSLSDRVKFAREQGAVLMLSLHADTLAYEPGVRGASIYTLSEKASDVISARLADSENKSDQIAGVEAREDDSHVGDILFDLTKRETRHFSHALARNLGESLPKSTSMHKNPLRSAGFRVLTAPDVPSVLIEVGYLSSAEDARLMQSDDWRGRMADAIGAAVEKYVGENATRTPNSAQKP